HSGHDIVIIDVSSVYVFFIKIRRAPSSTLFPYTTLFRSIRGWETCGARRSRRRGYCQELWIGPMVVARRTSDLSLVWALNVSRLQSVRSEQRREARRAAMSQALPVVRRRTTFTRYQIRKRRSWSAGARAWPAT